MTKLKKYLEKRKNELISMIRFHREEQKRMSREMENINSLLKELGEKE